MAMPTREQFDAAKRKLVAAGWVAVCAIMVDDAHKAGVTEFGTKFSKGAGQFWLNYKTIGQVDAVANPKPHDAGKESDLPEWLRP